MMSIKLRANTVVFIVFLLFTCVPFFAHGKSSIQDDRISDTTCTGVLHGESNRSEWDSSFTSVDHFNSSRYTLLVQAVRKTEYLSQVVARTRIVGQLKPYFFASVITETNNKTIWGSSGLILNTPAKNVVYASSQDMGMKARESLRIARTEGKDALNRLLDMKINDILSPTDLVKVTKSSSLPYSGYNEVLLRGSSESGFVQVVGFYYFMDDNRAPIMNSDDECEQIEWMKLLAQQFHLPMIGLKPTFSHSFSKICRLGKSIFEKSTGMELIPQFKLEN